MPLTPRIEFAAADALPEEGTLVVLRAGTAALPEGLPKGLAERLDHAARAAKFEGAFAKTLDLWAPGALEGMPGSLDRIVTLGIGPDDKAEERSWVKAGGALLAALGKAKKATVLAPGLSVDESAELALGIQLRAYKFDAYKADRKEREVAVTIASDDPEAAETAWKPMRGVGEGVLLARDLVNQPANVLTPKTFAKRAAKVEKLGCEVEVLNAKDMQKLGMRALLGVARGSRNAPRMVVMRWSGGKEGEPPIAFVGKGVTFDSGGISIKPSGGMEDMKGDMGGAAAVAGLMHALAARKAKVNAVGCIAMVENMPDGDAQRPGDIVRAMSGATIEIINTDAEGRLVLADAMHHVQEAFEPRMMIDLATLTGAVIVALGHHRAGMYSNDEALAKALTEAGEASGEKVWRMPLGPEYDKLIDTKNADMKNTGGRTAGSVTAAQFLQRFVKKGTPWVHLDVAGTAFGAPSDEVNGGWASGFGVRLLDRLVRDAYEG